MMNILKREKFLRDTKEERNRLALFNEKIKTEKTQKNSIKDIDEKQKDEEKYPKSLNLIEKLSPVA